MCQAKLSGEMVRVRKRKCFFSVKFYCECDAANKPCMKQKRKMEFNEMYQG